MVANVEEKSFPITDDLNLPGGRPEAEELLRHRLCVCCTESKIIGNKLIFKGSAQLQTLCRGRTADYSRRNLSCPSHRSWRWLGQGRSPPVKFRWCLSPAPVPWMGEMGALLSVALELLAQAVVRETRSVAMLSDVYSTTHTLVPDFRTYSLSQLLEQGGPASGPCGRSWRPARWPGRWPTPMSPSVQWPRAGRASGSTSRPGHRQPAV